MNISAILNRASPEGIDYRLYTDPDVYSLERVKIFRGPVWCYVALEAELDEPGAFKSTRMGDIPVVICRDHNGALHGWVNRCSHKGALICRSSRGVNSGGLFVCCYHQWSYDAEGNLRSVPYSRGSKGVGGLPSDFQFANHGLEKVRVEVAAGMVFATLNEDAKPLLEYLGEVMHENLYRIFNKPIKILGYARQLMEGNWKLYAENTRDSYHGGLLHLFYPTFGIYKPGQESSGTLGINTGHNLFTISAPGSDFDYDAHAKEANREMAEGRTPLQDPRVVEYRPDIGDGIILSIQSIFPSVVLQQIQNTLATRQVILRGPGATEVIWTYFGYSDDDPEMEKHRLRNMNLVGPAGYIAMEDGEAVEICEKGALSADSDERTVLKMGGGSIDQKVSPLGMDENAVRGFWKAYYALMRDAGECG